MAAKAKNRGLGRGLDALFADGEPVAEFQSGVREYVLPLVYGSAIPQFSATAPEGCIITYEQAETTADTAKITVTRDGRTVVYKISFKMEISVTDALLDSIVVGLPEGVQLPQATGVYATYEPESKHPAIHAIDQSMDTWWTSNVAGNYIEVDFGEVLDLTGVAVAFNYGEQRNYLFDILVSEDQMNYTRIYSGQSTGLTNEYEYIAVPIEARYIRLVGSGHLEGKWTAVKELQAVVASGEGSGSGDGSGDSGDDVIVPSGPKVYIDVNSNSDETMVKNNTEIIYFPSFKGDGSASWEAMTEGGKTYIHLKTASGSAKNATPSVGMETNATNLTKYVLEVDVYLSVAVDYEAGTCNVYKNGELVTENGCSLVDALKDNPEEVRLALGQGTNLDTYPNANNTANVWFDNIKLYEGLELLSEATE